MKKIIFILTVILFAISCSRGNNDRDNTETSKEYKLEPDFYKKFSAKYMYIRDTKDGKPIRLNTTTENDVYMIVNSDNTATLKIFNDTYSGPIELVNNNLFGLKHPKASRGIIYLQSSLRGRSISGLYEINDGIIKYDICGECSWPLEMTKQAYGE